MAILLADFSVKVGREDIFKPTTGNESMHEISNYNGVRVVNFATFKNFAAKVQWSDIVTFINLLGHLMGKLTIRLAHCGRQAMAFKCT
jgi:hypothetical protein